MNWPEALVMIAFLAFVTSGVWAMVIVFKRMYPK